MISNIDTSQYHSKLSFTEKVVDDDTYVDSKSSQHKRQKHIRQNWNQFQSQWIDWSGHGCNQTRMFPHSDTPAELSFASKSSVLWQNLLLQTIQLRRDLHHFVVSFGIHRACLTYHCVTERIRHAVILACYF